MSDPAIPQWVRGVTSRQAHVGLPPGAVEEEHSRSGFYGPASHLYRLHPPTDWTSATGPGVHRAYDTNRLADAADHDGTLGNVGIRMYVRNCSVVQRCYVHSRHRNSSSGYGVRVADVGRWQESRFLTSRCQTLTTCNFPPPHANHLR